MSDPIKTLSGYRLDKAKEELASAQVLFKGELFNQALNRAYYSIFHGMRAVLALEQFDSKKHSGIIAEFNLRYVKTGIFEKKYGRIIKEAEMLRMESDYKDFFVADKSEAEQLVMNAREFVNAVSRFLQTEGIVEWGM